MQVSHLGNRSKKISLEFSSKKQHARTTVWSPSWTTMDPPNPPSSLPRAATNTKSSSNTIACKFFLAGACAKPECKFSHDANDDQRPTTNDQPFYEKGKQNSCTYGDKCRYDHCNDDNNNNNNANRTQTTAKRRDGKTAAVVVVVISRRRRRG